MKTFILSLAAILFSTNLFFANGVKPCITTLEGKIVTISLADYSADNIHVTIIDFNGQKLHSEEINTNTYVQRRYNLENLPVGKYSIELNSTQRVVTKRININHSTIEMLEEDISFKPSLNTNGNYWNVNLLAQNKETKIEIYNDNYESLYRETFEDQMGIYKSFDFNKMGRGKYHMMIEVGDRSNTYTFEKS